MSISSIYMACFLLNILAMALNMDIIPDIDKYIYTCDVYGYNLSILWSPLKNRTPNTFTIVNFGHPVSKSWLRPC